MDLCHNTHGDSPRGLLLHIVFPDLLTSKRDKLSQITQTDHRRQWMYLLTPGLGCTASITHRRAASPAPLHTFWKTDTLEFCEDKGWDPRSVRLSARAATISQREWPPGEKLYMGDVRQENVVLLPLQYVPLLLLCFCCTAASQWQTEIDGPHPEQTSG